MSAPSPTISPDGSWRLVHHIGLEPDTVFDVVNRHLKALKDGGEASVQVLKPTPHRSMSLVALDHPRIDEVFVKHFHPSEIYKKFNQQLRGQSNARVIFEAGREFSRRGLHIPEVFAVVETNRPRFMGRNDSLLITASVSSYPSFEDLLREASTLPPSLRHRHKRILLSTLAQEWRRLHEAGIGYAESHTRHLFVAGKDTNLESESAPKLVWIDYDGTQFFTGATPRAVRINHFFHLSRDYRRKKRNRGIVSRADMLRFLHFYLSGGSNSHNQQSAQVKKLAREVLQWQPSLYKRVSTPVRDRLLHVLRPAKREVQRQKRERKAAAKAARTEELK